MPFGFKPSLPTVYVKGESGILEPLGEHHAALQPNKVKRDRFEPKRKDVSASIDKMMSVGSSTIDSKVKKG